MLRVKVTNDTEVVDRIREGLINTGGYCPCELEQTEDTKCLCKNFREQDEPGSCHCGLYEKVEV